jgi:hypothetical protein
VVWVLQEVVVATWFDLSYMGLAAAFLVLLAKHSRQALSLLPSNWLARGQWLYLLFLWCMVVGNFQRALVDFAPQRLVTEGLIFFNAVLCSVGLLLSARAGPGLLQPSAGPGPDWLRRTVRVGLVAATLSVVADWGVVRAIYGDRPAPHAGRSIRFGPTATAVKDEPPPSAPHP